MGDAPPPGTDERVGEAISGAHRPVFYLEIPPFLFGRVVRGLSEAGLRASDALVEGSGGWHEPWLPRCTTPDAPTHCVGAPGVSGPSGQYPAQAFASSKWPGVVG